MQALHFLRGLALRLWVAPASVVGLLAALPLLLRGAHVQQVGGVLEIAPRRARSRHRLQRARFIAITLGHVVLGESSAVLERWRRHEHAHVRQYERWGVLFFLAYPLASLWAWLSGDRPYWDNVFEREARAAEQ